MQSTGMCLILFYVLDQNKVGSCYEVKGTEFKNVYIHYHLVPQVKSQNCRTTICSNRDVFLTTLWQKKKEEEDKTQLN